MAAIASHFNFWNTTSEGALLFDMAARQTFEKAVCNNRCYCYDSFPNHRVWKFAGHFVSLERPFKETSVIAL